MTAIEPVDSFLLPTSSAPPPSLDFSDMRDSIKVFLRTFNAYITHACAEIEGSKRDHDATKVEESEKEKTLARDIADAKVAQKELWDGESLGRRTSMCELENARKGAVARTPPAPVLKCSETSCLHWRGIRGHSWMLRQI